MLTPSQHHDLTTNAAQRNLSQWAIRLRVNRNQLDHYTRKHGIRVQARPKTVKCIDLELLKREATTRTHQQWADYFGVSKERMYVVCSRERVKVKPNDRHRRINIEYLRQFAQERTHKEWAAHFGVTVNSMWNVCSNNQIKVKNSYGQIHPPR